MPVGNALKRVGFEDPVDKDESSMHTLLSLIDPGASSSSVPMPPIDGASSSSAPILPIADTSISS